MEQTIEAAQLDDRKIYVKPEVVHEFILETRAGTPLNALPPSPDDN